VRGAAPPGGRLVAEPAHALTQSSPPPERGRGLKAQLVASDSFVRFWLDDRTILSESCGVNGKQFIRQARKWARINGQPFSEDASRGKGGHQIVHVGDKWTTVKTGEIGVGLLKAMLNQLGIERDDF
jgi:hypothetical protein